MHNLAKSIQKTIIRHAINERAITSATGNIIITDKSLNYSACDTIIIEDESAREMATIKQLHDATTIETIQPLANTYTNGTIRKAYSGLILKSDNVIIGDPPTLPDFPAVCVEIAQKEYEPIALQTLDHTYKIEIKTYAQADEYGKGYQAVLAITQSIEDALFRSMFPLVEPYILGTLTETSEAGDTVIKTDADIRAKAPIMFENDLCTVQNFVNKHLGNGVFELSFGLTRTFDAGSIVYQPLRWFYYSQPLKSEVIKFESNQGTIFASRIIYSANEANYHSGTNVDTQYRT